MRRQRCGHSAVCKLLARHYLQRRGRRSSDHRRRLDRDDTAVHFHAPPPVAAGLELRVTDTAEISKVAWYDVDDISSLHASHKAWLDIAVRHLAEKAKKRGYSCSFDV